MPARVGNPKGSQKEKFLLSFLRELLPASSYVDGILVETEARAQETAENCISLKRGEKGARILTWRFQGQRFSWCAEALPLRVPAPGELAPVLPRPTPGLRKGTP